jgi:hypothetical protein
MDVVESQALMYSGPIVEATVRCGKKTRQGGQLLRLPRSMPLHENAARSETLFRNAKFAMGGGRTSLILK